MTTRVNNQHVLKWTEWDGREHSMTFPSAAAAAKTWRQLAKAAGMAVVQHSIEPAEGNTHVQH